MSEPVADLVVRDFSGNEVARIPVHTTNEFYIEKVMAGMLINMRDDCFIDDSEVDAARKAGK